MSYDPFYPDYEPSTEDLADYAAHIVSLELPYPPDCQSCGEPLDEVDRGHSLACLNPYCLAYRQEKEI